MSHLDLDWELPQRALFFERFSKFCRLIRFDKRGTGLSDRPVTMATLEERTDDIRAVMDDVGIKSANILEFRRVARWRVFSRPLIRSGWSRF